MRALTVLDILEETAARLPEKVFLRDEAETFSYRQFREEARTLGYALHRELNGTRRRPVILFMEKSCRCAAAMVGILYSGNFYVAADTKTPAERLNAILETMDPAAILTDEKSLAVPRKAGYSGDVLLAGELSAKWRDGQAEETVRRIKNSIIDTELMYVIFTSGSTGTPKGVAAMHRSVVDYIDSSIETIGIEEGDVIGNQGPFYTDMPLRDVFMVMKAGASACIIPQRMFMTPKKVLQILEENRVTNLMWVPTAYRLISQFDALEKIRPAGLRKLLFVGEAIPIPVYRYWREHYPEAEFRQLYGPSEVTGVCTCYRMERNYADGEHIPIGRPFPNTGLMLLDEEDREILPAETDKPGEICVFGTCLAAGYYNDPEKTAGAFVQNPNVTAYASPMYRTGDLGRWNDSGELVFISRKDYQIKHGGRRIELGEVEAAFQAVEGVKAVCCVQDRREDKLVLYYVGEPAEDEMPLLARNRLPKYMIPSEYRRLEQLPVLPNSKLDRKTMDRWANAPAEAEP